MTQLTNVDLHFVMSRCPRDIRGMLLEHPGELFLAGGFIRSTIVGERVSDIDLLGCNADALLILAKDLALSRKGRYFTTKNAATVLAPPRIPVQFITRWVFDHPVKCIESFDFTVCQAAIWAENDGPNRSMFRSAVSDGFYPDLAARRLTYTNPERNEDAGGSMLRVIKFAKRGYNIQAPSLARVIVRLMNKVDKDKVAGMKSDGTAKWAEKVVTGLLREVDPLSVVDGVDFVDEHEIEAQQGEEE